MTTIYFDNTWNWKQLTTDIEKVISTKEMTKTGIFDDLADSLNDMHLG